jgi:hypothetical protein
MAGDGTGEGGEGAGNEPGGGGGGEQRPRVIAYDRFEEVYDKWKTAEREIDQRVQTRTSELQQQLDAERAGRAEDRAFFGVGLTDEDAQDAARMLYGKIPEADRPKGGMGEWLQGFGEGEGKTAPPKLLAPFLTSGSSGKGSEPRTPNGGAGGGPSGADSKVTAEAVRAARVEAQRTGNWEKFDALVASINE